MTQGMQAFSGGGNHSMWEAATGQRTHTMPASTEMLLLKSKRTTVSASVHHHTWVKTHDMTDRSPQKNAPICTLFLPENLPENTENHQ